jgi:hypothetical protein
MRIILIFIFSISLFLHCVFIRYFYFIEDKSGKRN